MFETRNRLLGLLGPADWNLLAPQLRRHAFRRGEVVSKPGHRPEHIYFLESGMASVFSPIDDMPVESCSIGREGAVNLITVMGGGRSFTSCVMQVAGEASCLEAGAWKALCKRSESLEGVALRYAHASWTHALQLAACNSRHSLEQRFARKLLACSVLLDSNEVRLTQAFLADALGVQRTSIVKVASALQDSGIVRYRAGVITILHRRRLTSVSCGCFQLIADTYRRIYLNQALNA